MNTFSIYLILILIVAFLLIVAIMVQNPKGGGLSSSFGGGGGAQQVGGVKQTSDFLDKSTWFLATLLLVLILLSNVTIMNSGATDSKILNSDSPKQEQTQDAIPEAPENTKNNSGTSKDNQSEN